MSIAALVICGLLFDVVDDEDWHGKFISLLQFEPKLLLHGVEKGDGTWLFQVSLRSEAQREVVCPVEAGGVDDRDGQISRRAAESSVVSCDIVMFWQEMWRLSSGLPTKPAAS